MIPAENREYPRFAWLPMGQALPVTARLALHRGNRRPLVINDTLIASPQGTWWIAPADMADGEIVCGDLMMPNKTIESDLPGIPAVELPSVYRLMRALEHATQNDMSAAQDFDQVGVALGREIVRSQLLNAHDVDGQMKYNQRLTSLFETAKRRLERSSKPKDKRLLEKIERAGNLIDSRGRFNRCSLPLVIRLVQRLASTKAKDQRMRGLDTRVAATTLEEAVARLEARTEWLATQLIQLARSPGLQKSRWTHAAPRERSTFKRRIRIALELTLPDMEQRLTEWTLPEPFRKAYKDAMAPFSRGRALLQAFYEGLDRRITDEVLHQTMVIREEFAKAAQALAKALLVPIFHDLLFPIAIAFRAASSGVADRTELLKSVRRDALQNVPLTLDAITALEEAFGKGFENTGFRSSIAAAKRVISYASKKLPTGEMHTVYQYLRSVEFLIAE